MSSVGKLTAAFIAIINFERQESHLQSTQYEPRSHTQNQQPTISGDRRLVFRVVAYRLPYPPPFLIWWATIDFEHRHQSNSIFVYLFKHVGQVNLMMLALKSGPQIAAKVGNPAGLLCQRIWYSVGKSGVLGITEYRQGRPLRYDINLYCPVHRITAHLQLLL